jgi:ribosomal protein S21
MENTTTAPKKKSLFRQPVKSTRPVHVEVNGEECNFDIEVMIKKFNKKVKKSGLMQMVRDRRYYEKDSVKERRKRLDRTRISRNLNEKAKAKMPDKK